MTTTRMPFVCTKCGLRYGDRGGPSLLTVEGDATNITVSGNRMSCPRCGTMNRQALPDGEYNIHNGKWHLVRQIARSVLAADATNADFEELARLISLAQANSDDIGQVAADIERNTPFAQLAQFLREHRSDAIGVLSVLLAVVLWLIPSPTSGSAGQAHRASITSTENLSPRQLDELAGKIADDLADKTAKVPVSTGYGTRPPGRNQPCSCGSKIKYKKCCGDPRKR
jgi:hypothetical protein